jgi:hypothetical protein
MDAPEKLWVDDTREAPVGWTWLKNFSEARERLLSGKPFSTISLDHNLGGKDPNWGWAKNGQDVLTMLVSMNERGRADFKFTVSVHTSSKRYRPEMEAFAREWEIEVVKPPIEIPLEND